MAIVFFGGTHLFFLMINYVFVDDFGTKPTIWLWWGRSLHEAVFVGYTTWEDEYILLFCD